ncbi:MAG TPA: response regulator transcription factor [Solirubrobacter sp.]|nr:response regulator transcription factor [Solirubrobacter sp.]
MTTTTRRTRIVLVEDHALVRSGFKAPLDEQPDLEVTGEAADGAAGVEIALERHDDVVPMDLRMPVLDGIEATRRLGVDSRPQAVVLADESGRPGHTGDDPL